MFCISFVGLHCLSGRNSSKDLLMIRYLGRNLVDYCTQRVLLYETLTISEFGEYLSFGKGAKYNGSPVKCAWNIGKRKG